MIGNVNTNYLIPNMPIKIVEINAPFLAKWGKEKGQGQKNDMAAGA